MKKLVKALCAVSLLSTMIHPLHLFAEENAPVIEDVEEDETYSPREFKIQDEDLKDVHIRKDGYLSDVLEANDQKEIIVSLNEDGYYTLIAKDLKDHETKVSFVISSEIIEVTKDDILLSIETLQETMKQVSLNDEQKKECEDLIQNAKDILDDPASTSEDYEKINNSLTEKDFEIFMMDSEPEEEPIDEEVNNDQLKELIEALSIIQEDDVDADTYEKIQEIIEKKDSLDTMTDDEIQTLQSDLQTVVLPFISSLAVNLLQDMYDYSIENYYEKLLTEDEIETMKNQLDQTISFIKAILNPTDENVDLPELPIDMEETQEPFKDVEQKDLEELINEFEEALKDSDADVELYQDELDKAKQVLTLDASKEDIQTAYEMLYNRYHQDFLQDEMIKNLDVDAILTMLEKVEEGMFEDELYNEIKDVLKNKTILEDDQASALEIVEYKKELSAVNDQIRMYIMGQSMKYSMNQLIDRLLVDHYTPESIEEFKEKVNEYLDLILFETDVDMENLLNSEEAIEELNNILVPIDETQDETNDEPEDPIEKVDVIEKVDNKADIVDNPKDDKNTNTGIESVPTSDSTNITYWFVLLGISLIGIVVLSRRKEYNK